MKVTDLIKVIQVFPCGLRNGNYKHDFKRKSDNTYFDIKPISFQEILEKEKLKYRK